MIVGFGSSSELIRPGPLRDMALDRAVITCLRLTNPHNRQKWASFLANHIAPSQGECHRIMKKFWWHFDHPWAFTGHMTPADDIGRRAG